VAGYNGGMSKPLPPFVVGQTIFLIPNESRSVIPAIVVEEITKKTINGSHTSWAILTPNNPKPVKLDPSTCEIFINLSDVKDSLLQRVTLAIENMIDEVRTISEELNGGSKSTVNETAPSVITLEDGTKVRVVK
jgi:hypothetical protein